MYVPCPMRGVESESWRYIAVSSKQLYARIPTQSVRSRTQSARTPKHTPGMLRFLLALLVCSASSLKTTPAQCALRLRGGGDLATPLLYATSVIGGATGVSMYLGKESVTKTMWLGLNEFGTDKVAAVAMIGWAVGKFTAARAGSDSAKSFAQLNVLPLLLWTIAQFTEGNGLTSAIFPALLLAAYIYTGFVAE